MPYVVRFTAPGKVELAEEAAPPLGVCQVRVRTSFSGISAGTELTAYRGTNPYLTHRWDSDDRLFVPDVATVSYPIDGWGYSEVGQVVEAAPDVIEPKVGDVVWGIWGHRQEAVVEAGLLRDHVLPPGVPEMNGVFARVCAIALNAILASEVRLGEGLVVFGQGVIGLLATRLAVLSGADVFAVDSVPARREAALALGAREVASPSDDVVRRLRQVTGGRGATWQSSSPGPTARCTRPSGRSASAAGSSPPRSTRATASGCDSVRSSTTTGSRSSRRRSAGCRRQRLPGGRWNGCRGHSWVWSPTDGWILAR